MYNIILDRLPTDYKGYLIRTDFRIGIQILLCLQDEELNQIESIITAFSLLFGKGIPPIDVAIEGLKWFAGGGKETCIDNDACNKKVICFEKDSTLIYSAFMKVYGIDLKTSRIHWFEFLNLMQDLGKCALTNIIEIRSKDLTKLKGEERTAYARLQKIYSLANKNSKEDFTDEEKRKLEEFYNTIGGDIEWQEQ